MNLRILIPVALITMGAGLYGVSGHLMTKPVIEEPEVIQKKEPQIRIWQLKENRQAGQLIRRDDLKVQMVSEAEANERGIAEDIHIDFVKGMVAGAELAAERWVTGQDFVKPDEPQYIELTTQEGRVPYPIKVHADTIIGGVIDHGSLVDIIALSSTSQNLANEETVQEYQSVSISPVLMAIKVIQVQKPKPIITDKAKKGAQKPPSDVTLVLELTRRQLAKLVIAKKIAQLEVHKSVGMTAAEQLQANSGDVLPTYQAIKEFRAGEASIR